jgi:LysR family transcriptional regulator, glycine cleavage system transcriptional activator
VPQRLPPLGALRAFDAAARHLSFKQAASELHVSPAAISHQIHALEDYLGVQLFERLNRGLNLTDIARAALPRISDGFHSLGAGVELMRATDGGINLSVRSGPAFAAKWLVPRLHRFAAANPDVDVFISASMHAVDGRRAETHAADEGNDESPDDFDVQIRFGNGSYPGYSVDKLLQVSLTPVCSPTLLTGKHGLSTAHDLCHHTLLHDDALATQEGRPDWSMWLRQAAATEINAARGSHFTHSALALQAAADGLGVALAMDVLAAEDLAAGRLVAPFAIEVPLPLAYYVVSPAARVTLPLVEAFRQWLLREAHSL